MRRITVIKAALMGSSFCLALYALPRAAQAQISTVNSAVIESRVFNDMSNGVGTYINTYPTSITLGETGVGRVATGGLDRDVWYFSANGTTPYLVQNQQYFDSTFTVNMTGGTAGTDLEAGYIFKNSSGSFGGDDQMIVQNSGGVVQFGGPSFFDFVAHGSPPYVEGTPETFGFNYVVDPNTGLDAFQYSANGVFAMSGLGTPYFDLGGPLDGDPLGGYFQIGNAPSGSNSGQAIFTNMSITPVAVPEPASLSMLAIGGIALVGRRRSKRSV